MTYLHKHPRNGGYWFRRGILQAIRPVLNKGYSSNENLGTKDGYEARIKVLAIAARVESIVQQTQAELATKGEIGPAICDPAIFIALLSSWKERETYTRAQRALEGQGCEAFQAECRIAGACGSVIESDTAEEEANIEAVWQKVRQIAHEGGLLLNERHISFYMFSRQVSETWVEILEEEARWRRFELGSLPANIPPP